MRPYKTFCTYCVFLWPLALALLSIQRALVIAAAHLPDLSPSPWSANNVLDPSHSRPLQVYQGQTHIRDHQQVYRGPMSRPHAVPAAQLGTEWKSVGPWPAGMRELPFDALQSDTTGPIAELLKAATTSTPFRSTYGQHNGTLAKKIFRAIPRSPRFHPLGAGVGQDLSVTFDDVEWEGPAYTQGWASKQWQALLATTLTVTEHAEETRPFAFVLDKAAEFCVIEHGFNASSPVEWHSGDWYSYNMPTPPMAPQSAYASPATHPHILRLPPGDHTLIVRVSSEVRIFGSSPGKVPGVQIGIDVQPATDSVRAVASAPLGIAPDVVGGWLAGRWIRLGVVNTQYEYLVITSVKVTGTERLRVGKLPAPKRLVKDQTRLLTVEMLQTESLPAETESIELSIEYRHADHGISTLGAVLPLRHRTAYWNDKSSHLNSSAASFSFTFIGPDCVADHATAVPPQLAWESGSAGAARPPIILGLHGAGVDTRDPLWAGAFDRHPFSWIVLPTGRTPWGYDWQLSSFASATLALVECARHPPGLPASVSDAARNRWSGDGNKIFVAGHSNGGQGAWYRMTHYPDQVVGGIVAAGYIKLSDYVPFNWQSGRHFTDPSLSGILQSSLAPFSNDLHVSNLAGLPLLVKYGSIDSNVPAWHSREMAALISSWNSRSSLNASLLSVSEHPGQDHWWDSIMRDDDVRTHLESVLSPDQNPGWEWPSPPDVFTLSVTDPYESGPKRGWSITQVEIPGRLASIQVRYLPSDNPHLQQVYLRTVNVRSLKLDSPKGTQLNIDGQNLRLLASNDSKVVVSKADSGHTWSASGCLPAKSRPIGPFINLLHSSSGPLQVIVPTRVSPAGRAHYVSVAQRFAADTCLYGLSDTEIIDDVVAIQKGFDRGNILLLGGVGINLVADVWATDQQLGVAKFLAPTQFTIRDRIFDHSDTALLTLLPHPLAHEHVATTRSPRPPLAALLHAHSPAALERGAKLLPARTGVMVPEWIVVGSDSTDVPFSDPKSGSERHVGLEGFGSVRAAGWYDTDWGWSEAMSYV